MRSKIATMLLITLTFIGIVAMSPVSSAAAAAASKPEQAICDIWVGGHYGQYICEYGYTFWEWSDGRDHWFVIGKDYAVWNILQYPDGTYTGWRSLGGAARSGVHIEGNPSAGSMDISVVGTDFNWWCNYLPRLGGSWNGWRRC